MGRVFSTSFYTVIFIVSLLVFLPQATEIQTKSTIESNQPEKTGLPSYIPHSPITITEDIDFFNQGWPGNGTKNDPYVITGLSITTTSTGISISDTRVYFEIRNCLINASSLSGNPGIYLYNATNGVVESSIVDSHSYGIDVYWSHHSLLINNTASHNQDHGIHIRFSENCTLIENNVDNNSWNGIKLSSGFNTTLIGNTAFNNSVDGFNLEGTSVNCTLLDNEAIENSQHGFWFWYSHFTYLENNSAIGNQEQGFEMHHALFYEFSRNTAINNRYGYGLFSSDHGTIINNTAVDNRFLGFYFSTSDSLYVSKNNASENGSSGFSFYYADFCEVEDNTALDNFNSGFSFSLSDFNEVTNNVAMYNSPGFSFSQSTYSNVTENTAIDNGSTGFGFGTVNHLVVENNVAFGHYTQGYGVESVSYCNFTNNQASDSIWGFFIWVSDHCRLEGNILTDNSNYGLYLRTLTNYTITNNTIAGNSIYGVYLYPDCEDNLFYLNWFGGNGDANAYDDGVFNNWDNGTHGNYWSDYSGSGVYDIPGTASSVDHYPFVYLYSPPELNHPLDVEYIVGATGHTISWIANGSHPVSYRIFRNDVIVRSGAWNSSSEVIAISVDGLDVGSYIYRIEVVDTLDVGVGDLVTVVVVQSTSTTTTSTITDSTTTPTNGPNGGSFDQTMVIIIGGITLVLVIVVIVFKKKT